MIRSFPEGESAWQWEESRFLLIQAGVSSDLGLLLAPSSPFEACAVWIVIAAHVCKLPGFLFLLINGSSEAVLFIVSQGCIGQDRTWDPRCNAPCTYSLSHQEIMNQLVELRQEEGA